MNTETGNAVVDPAPELREEVARKQLSATKPPPKLRITLYPPDGEPEVYEDCTVLSGLMPELEFKGKKLEILEVPRSCPRFQYRAERTVHVTSTTLPYKIEALTDVVH